MKPSAWQGICLVFRKELTAGLRFRAAWAAMLMFALTTLACASMALQGGSLEPRMQAALLWIILFFASMAGADRVFADESTAGTLLTLRVYGASQAVLLGKLCYTFFLLLVLAAFTVPLFLVFLDVTVKEPLVLLGAVLLGTGGIAAAGTLIAALTTDASTHSGLFSVPIAARHPARSRRHFADGFVFRRRRRRQSISWRDGALRCDSRRRRIRALRFPLV